MTNKGAHSRGAHVRKEQSSSAYRGNRGIAGVFIASALVLMLSPSVGMIWFPTESTSGVDEPAAAPSFNLTAWVITIAHTRVTPVGRSPWRASYSL